MGSDADDDYCFRKPQQTEDTGDETEEADTLGNGGTDVGKGPSVGNDGS